MCSLQRCRGVQNQSHQSISVLPTHLDSAEIRARFAALPAQRQAEIRARPLLGADGFGRLPSNPSARAGSLRRG